MVISAEEINLQFGSGDAPILLHPRGVLLQRVHPASLLDDGEVVFQIVRHQPLKTAEVRSVRATVQQTSSAAEANDRRPRQRRIERPSAAEPFRQKRQIAS